MYLVNRLEVREDESGKEHNVEIGLISLFKDLADAIGSEEIARDIMLALIKDIKGVQDPTQFRALLDLQKNFPTIFDCTTSFLTGDLQCFNAAKVADVTSVYYTRVGGVYVISEIYISSKCRNNPEAAAAVAADVAAVAARSSSELITKKTFGKNTLAKTKEKLEGRKIGTKIGNLEGAIKVSRTPVSGGSRIRRRNTRKYKKHNKKLRKTQRGGERGISEEPVPGPKLSENIEYRYEDDSRSRIEADELFLRIFFMQII
jgi:hypothetical protein